MNVYSAGLKRSKKKHFHPNWIFFAKIFLFCWCLFGVNDLLSFFLYSHNYSRILNGLSFAALLSLPAIFMKRMTRLYLFAVYLILLIPSAIFFMHLLLFQQPIAGNAYYALYESPLSEATEFVRQQLTPLKTSLLLAYSILPLFFFIRLGSAKIFPDIRFRFLLFLLCLIGVNAYHSRLQMQVIRNDSYLLDMLYSHSDYQNEKYFLKEEITKRLSKLNTEPVKNLMPEGMEPVLVFVIGESATRNHMSLYGYKRNTNKLLNGIKEKLFVFDSVFSPSAHTIPALRNALSFSTREDTLPFYKKKSIIELLNAGGYETYWISNQKSLGVYETQTSVVAGSARHIIYINDRISSWKNEYDEALLPPLSEALKSGKKKKAIFIHLIGAHEDFKYRYPGSYNFFQNSEGIVSPFANADTYKTSIINTYDNAILYNDFVVRKIIEITAQNAPESVVLTFSDHGEEVYDTHDLSGHAGWAPTKSMYEIPFILWASDSMISKNPSFFNPIDSFIHRSYCSEDLIHSMLDLSMLRCRDYDSTRSVFSAYYQARPTYILQLK
jgi:heptose-I-phosphate ethanolaminephosphotransferase